MAAIDITGAGGGGGGGTTVVTGGGAGTSYYFNGSVSQGTLGGNSYFQASKIPVFATSANFTINADGYIANFITDAGDPGLISIPAGNWNFELYFSASSNGGNPRFYVELLKYDGSTFTSIASGVSSPESITNGTTKDLYLYALAVPATSLTVTDRLAVRVYVIHDGRTITLYTQDANLSQVVTTFAPVQQIFQVACSDMYTAISATNNIAYFRSPISFLLLTVRASLFTAQTSGSIFTIDIKKNGVSMLSTLITIDNNEKTSLTAATQPVLSTNPITNDDIITFDVTQAGTGPVGLIVTLIGV
jgi:hypothetical protein